MFKQFVGSLKSVALIYSYRHTSLGRVILYYLLLILLLAFPLNLSNVRNKGLNLNKEKRQITSMITEDYIEDLPADCDINGVTGLSCHQSEQVEIDAGGIKMIINALPTYKPEKNSLVFYPNHITFMKETLVKESTYRSYEGVISFSDLKDLPVEEATATLISGFEESFEAIDILNGVIFVTGSYLLMNTIYILLAASLSMLLKFAHPRFLSYKEIVKLFVYASTWPTLIGLVLGLFELQPFTPVVYQFGTPLMFLLVYYKQIKPEVNQVDLEQND